MVWQYLLLSGMLCQAREVIDVPDSESFELSSFALGPLPIVQRVLEELRVEQLIERHLPEKDQRLRLPHATTLGVVLRNIVLGRSPLYGLREWAEPYDPALLGPDMDADQVQLLNDDRVGRALDRLFDADRASLLTAVIVRAIREHDIDMKRFHNDSTSITFSGQYASATGRRIRGKRAAAIKHGHNKDHRPDLKQLLWVLTVSADGWVPIHYRVFDGNTPDDPTHIEIWEAVRELAGRPDFLYVADSKLCSRQNMKHLASRQGRFVCVLPKTRKEDAWFRQHIQQHEVNWEVVVRRPNLRRLDGPEDIWRVVKSPVPSAEGYRVVWVWSVRLAEHQLRARFATLQKAWDGVAALNERLKGKRCRFKTREAVEEAVEAILKRSRVHRWVDVEIHEDTESRFKQSGPGRPGPKTRYVRQDRVRFRLDWKPRAEVIEYDAKSDGMYPLITNTDESDLSNGEVLMAHKEQPHLEKRHEQLKSVYGVAPALLKNEGRIEALLFLYFVAMLVQALIERRVRRAMEAEDIKVLPLYHEERACRAPTADKILGSFEGLQRHELWRHGSLHQRFRPTLSELQNQLLRLLGLPGDLYAACR